MTHKTIVFVGPSAVGKTYIATLLLSKYPGVFEQAKLYTTRQPRPKEKHADRIFVSKIDFKARVANLEFPVYGEFGGNWYGFSTRALTPTDKHILVSTWCKPIPEFAKIRNVLLVGMDAAERWHDLLVERMRDRGDNDDTIKKRIELIKQDIYELHKYANIIKKHGQLFTVENDQTIGNIIIPWIEQELSL